MFGYVKVDGLSLEEKIKLLKLENLSLKEKMEVLNLDNLTLEQLLNIKAKINERLVDRILNEDLFLELDKKYKRLELYIEYTRKDKKRYIDKIKFILSEDNILLGIVDKNIVNFYIGVVDQNLNVLLLNFDKLGNSYHKVEGKVNLQSNLLDNSAFNYIDKFGDIISKMSNVEMNNTLYELLPNYEDVINYDDEYEKNIIIKFINKMKQYFEFNNLVNLILDIPSNKKRQKQRKL